jgi:hypothetical protein
MTAFNIEEFKDWFLKLQDADKLIFLPLVLGHLTIHGRAFGLDLSGEEQIRAFRGLNELNHQISFYFAGIGEARQNRYPDDVFLQILFEKAASFGLSPHLEESLQYARAAHNRANQR